MGREEELEKEIGELKAELKDREDSLPAHSVRPQQMLVIEELETALDEKKGSLISSKRPKVPHIETRYPYGSVSGCIFQDWRAELHLNLRAHGNSKA